MKPVLWPLFLCFFLKFLPEGPWFGSPPRNPKRLSSDRYEEPGRTLVDSSPRRSSQNNDSLNWFIFTISGLNRCWRFFWNTLVNLVSEENFFEGRNTFEGSFSKSSGPTMSLSRIGWCIWNCKFSLEKINPAKVCSLTKKWQYLYKSRAINHFRFKTGPNMFFFFSYLAHLTFQKKLDKVLGKRIFPKFAHDECPVYQVTPPMPTELLLRFLLSSSTTIRLFIGPLDVTFQNKTSRISGEKKHR